MPTYEYQCADCKQHFEIKQSFSDVPLSVCPNCGGKIHRVIQPAGIVFKGSGFYVTDSRGKQNLTTSGEKKLSAEGGSTGSESGSSDSAAKSDSSAKGEKSDGKSSEGKSESASKSESKSESAPKPEPAKSSTSSSNGGSADKN